MFVCNMTLEMWVKVIHITRCFLLHLTFRGQRSLGYGTHRGQPPWQRAGWRRVVSRSGGAARDMPAQPLVEYIKFMKVGTLFVLLIAIPLPRTVPVG